MFWKRKRRKVSKLSFDILVVVLGKQSAMWVQTTTRAYHACWATTNVYFVVIPENNQNITSIACHIFGLVGLGVTAFPSESPPAPNRPNISPKGLQSPSLHIRASYVRACILFLPDDQTPIRTASKNGAAPSPSPHLHAFSLPPSLRQNKPQSNLGTTVNKAPIFHLTRKSY